MAKRTFTAEDLYQMVGCCYFTGRCRTCPFWKLSGFANIGKCLGPQVVGQALMDGIERLIKLEKEPTLFELEDGEEEPAASGQGPVSEGEQGTRNKDRGVRSEK